MDYHYPISALVETGEGATVPPQSLSPSSPIPSAKVAHHKVPYQGQIIVQGYRRTSTSDVHAPVLVQGPGLEPEPPGSQPGRLPLPHPCMERMGCLRWPTYVTCNRSHHPPSLENNPGGLERRLLRQSDDSRWDRPISVASSQEGGQSVLWRDPPGLLMVKDSRCW